MGIVAPRLYATSDRGGAKGGTNTSTSTSTDTIKPEETQNTHVHQKSTAHERQQPEQKMAQVNGNTGTSNTPPPAPPTDTQTATQQNQSTTANTTTTTTTPPAPTQPASKPPPSPKNPLTHPLPHASTSTTDSGSTPRPRDARTLHMLLNALSIPSYQDRIPLLLLDFAYRYTMGTLSDAQHLASEGYGSATGPVGGAGARARESAREGELNVQIVRMAVASRAAASTGGAGSGGAGSGGGLAGGGGTGAGTGAGVQCLPKESMMELGRDVNAVRLGVGEGEGLGRFGVRLPGEKYVLSGVGWGLDGVPEVEGGSLGFDGVDEDDDGEDGAAVTSAGVDQAMPNAGEREEEDAEDGDEDGADTERDGFTQVFGSTADADADESKGKPEADSRMGGM